MTIQVSQPITETAYADRTFYAVKTIVSSDGLTTFNVPFPQKMKFKDTNGTTLEINFKDHP